MVKKNEEPETLGQFIKRKRLALNISQKDVAEHIGSSTAQYVSNIERDVQSIPKKHIKGIAEILKISPLTLVMMIMRRINKEYIEAIK